jgi:hypothetical protein
MGGIGTGELLAAPIGREASAQTVPTDRVLEEWPPWGFWMVSTAGPGELRVAVPPLLCSLRLLPSEQLL